MHKTKWLRWQPKMRKRYRQSGKGFPLLAAAIPLAKLAVPFLGKAALGRAVSFGTSKILRKRKRKRRRYRRYIK